jgi:type I restriction enzyme S subunit
MALDDLDTRRVTFDYLHQALVFRGLSDVISGSAQPQITRQGLSPVVLPLPPLPEQRKIAAILSSVDEAIEGTQAVIDQLQVVKKAMMAELLTRGIPGRHTKFKTTEIGEVPEDWEVVHAGDLCEVITKGTTPAAQTRDAGEVPFFKVYNIDPRGFIDFDYQPTFIPRSVHLGELKRSRIVPGDVLMNIVGPPLGKVAIVPSTFSEANINQAIAVFRPARVESAYLALCLEAESLFSWAFSRAKRTSTQLNLTLELCRDYPLPLPPENEREEITKAILGCKSRVQAEIGILDGLYAVKSALMSVLLTGEVRVQPDGEAA